MKQIFDVQGDSACLEKFVEWNRRGTAGRNRVTEAAQFLVVPFVRSPLQSTAASLVLVNDL